MKTKVAIDSKGISSKSNKENLENKNDSNNGNKHPVSKNVTEDIDLYYLFCYLVVDFSGIHEVKNLHHHESIEDKGHMS